nr:MAG TPA: hypothetical protein [Caudoviricetes sp.]
MKREPLTRRHQITSRQLHRYRSADPALSGGGQMLSHGA